MTELLLRLLNPVLRLPIISWFRGSHMLNMGITYGYIRVIRIVHIGGRYGGYKTPLSVWLAHKLWADGFVESVYSNMRCVLADDPEMMADTHDPLDVRAVVIFDEAGQFFETRRDVKNLIAFLRKMKLYLLLPSVEPPTTRVSRLSIEPLFNFTLIGVPLVIYRTLLKGSRRQDDKVSYFAWWKPSCTFGIYDTKDAPVSGMGIDKALIELKNQMATKLDETSRYYDPLEDLRRGHAKMQIGEIEPGGAQITDDVDRIEELVEAMQDTIEGADQSKRARGWLK